MVRRKILNMIVMTACLASCAAGRNAGEYAEVRVDLLESCLDTKAADPDETRISDVSFMVFDEYGRLEEHLWKASGGAAGCSFRLLSGKAYRFVVCANFGYEVSAADLDELSETRYYLAYPDEYREGIPMMADSGYIGIDRETQIRLELIRLMSKISIRMDRSRLSDEVEMTVRGVRIGNCPKCVTVFSESRMKSPDERFNVGFSREDSECRPLNMPSHEIGLSEEISMYMLENMQGRFSGQEISEDHEKVFGNDDIRKDLCSYIELDLDYISDEKISQGGFLTYRFYLGEDRNSLDVERNCHYRITVAPEDDGLKGDGWRTDKSSLIQVTKPSLMQYPGDYITGNIGDRIHIGCKLSPADTPFDVGLEYLKDDKAAGIYDFEIDADGHGATLTLTGPGRGLVYMSAGEPINDSALWIIEVNRPDS